MFYLSEAAARVGSSDLHQLQLRQTVTSQGKKWEMITKKEQYRGEGQILAEGKALQKLFEEVAKGQPLDGQYEELGKIFEFQHFAEKMTRASKVFQDVYREGLKNWEMPRRLSDFESGKAGAEGAQPKGLSDAGGSQKRRLADAGKTKFSITSGIYKTSQIRFIPETLKIESSFLRELQHVLAENFDTSIQTITLLSKPDCRNGVFRIELKDGKQQVIYKESHPNLLPGEQETEQHRKEADDRLAREWAGTKFVSGLQTEDPLCPRCFGGSMEYHFFLQQDMGEKQVNLENHLRGNDPVKAKEGLARYMSTLGRLHAAGSAHVDRYREILHEIRPEVPRVTAEAAAKECLGNLRNALDSLGLTPREGLEEEIGRVTSSAYEGPFVTVTHGDPCPDNLFDYPDRVLFIDFEMTGAESALLDMTYPRMNMPTGGFAGRIPEDILDAIEASYREQLKAGIPLATDDKAYEEAYAAACALHLLRQDMAYLNRVIEQDDDHWGGISVRARVNTHLPTFIAISKKYDTLPVLRKTAEDIFAALHRKWKNAKPLDFYPAFAGNPI